MVIQHSIVAQYHASLVRYLQSRKAALSPHTPGALVAALCRGRGALNLAGMGYPLGEMEQRAVSLLTLYELHTVVRGIQIESLSTRVTHFVRLSEAKGGDVSLVVHEDQQA